MSSATVKTVALFGGAFNPPHIGHTLLALYVLETAPVDELWVMPSFRHPFDKRLVPFADRFEMCRLALAPLGERARVSRVEEELGGEGRTLYTLRHLLAREPGLSLRLVIGSDILREREKWLGWPEIERLAPPLYVARAGYPAPEVEGRPVLPEVSSTEVRARLAAGQDVAALLPRAVLDYIQVHRLYREETT